MFKSHFLKNYLFAMSLLPMPGIARMGVPPEEQASVEKEGSDRSQRSLVPLEDLPTLVLPA